MYNSGNQQLRRQNIIKSSDSPSSKVPGAQTFATNAPAPSQVNLTNNGVQQLQHQQQKGGHHSRTSLIKYVPVSQDIVPSAPSQLH